MSEPSAVLGIDLGTTNSVVAVADGESVRALHDVEGRRLIPSCVSFGLEGPILVGHEARERRLIDAENTVYSIKRLIGRPFGSPEVDRAQQRFPFALEPAKNGGVQVRVQRGTYALAEVSAFVLRHLRKLAEESLGMTCSRAVVTVPANFNELQRSATHAAARVAGLDVLRILNEPTAATLAYGYGRDRPERVAVYDFGGGTFDVTLLDLDGDIYEVVSTAGDTFLGGDDIDIAIAEKMISDVQNRYRFDASQKRQVFERMRAAAEWAKCQLSSVTEVELTLEQLFEDTSSRSIDYVFTFSRLELIQLMRPLVAKTFDVVQDALRDAGRRPKEIDSVVLVGGSTRIPLVREMVSEFFGIAPETHIDPDLVVAQGAAIHAWTLAGRPLLRADQHALARVALRRVATDPSERKRGAAIEAVPRQPAFAPDQNRVSQSELDEMFAPTPSTPISVPPSLRAGNTMTSGLLDLDDPLGGGRRPAPTGAPPPGPTSAPPIPHRDFSNLPVARRSMSAAADISRTLPGTAPIIATGDPATRMEPPPRPATPVRRAPPPIPIKATIPSAPPPARSPFDDLPSENVDVSLLGLPAPPSDDLPLPEIRESARPPSLAPRVPMLEMTSAHTPLLMDITPLSLGLETAGGYSTTLVPRNAPVPAERSRIFSTAKDNQSEVEVRVCQGESRRFEANQLLGTLFLDQLRSAPRGAIRIEVTFVLDASGILDVRATDLDTKRVQHTRIQLRGGLENEEVEAMRARQERDLG